jgi:hypothetical protein
MHARTANMSPNSMDLIRPLLCFYVLSFPSQCIPWLSTTQMRNLLYQSVIFTTRLRLSYHNTNRRHYHCTLRTVLFPEPQRPTSNRRTSSLLQKPYQIRWYLLDLGMLRVIMCCLFHCSGENMRMLGLRKRTWTRMGHIARDLDFDCTQNMYPCTTSPIINKRSSSQFNVPLDTMYNNFPHRTRIYSDFNINYQVCHILPHPLLTSRKAQ